MKNYKLDYLFRAYFSKNSIYPFSAEVLGLPVVAYGRNFWELRENSQNTLEIFLRRFINYSGKIPFVPFDIKSFSEDTLFVVQFDSNDLVDKALSIISS